MAKTKFGSGSFFRVGRIRASKHIFNSGPGYQNLVVQKFEMSCNWGGGGGGDQEISLELRYYNVAVNTFVFCDEAAL